MVDLPKMKWLNSYTKSVHGCQGPHVVHDGMPDGVFYAPTPSVIAQIIKTWEQTAYRDWFRQPNEKF
jgi:hypothetical protein